jgi:dipeptidyl aminopeptidase/acylaminoacyl peptidase
MHSWTPRVARATALLLGFATTTALVGCTGAGASSSSAPRSSYVASAGASASAEASSSFEQDARTLRTIAAAADDGSKLTVRAELSINDAYASHAATYTSDGLTISAVLIEPLARGPHPGVVLVHGFVDPATYTSGGELQREQDALARAGYVVLYTDLRGLGSSAPAPAGPPDLDMGVTDDVINAVRALAGSGLPDVEPGRIALLGHSLGGLLVLNVLAAKPGLVDAAVAFAPSNADRWTDVQQYLTPGDPSYQAIIAAHGTPDTNEQYWADISPSTFVQQVSDPLLVVHGDADTDSPYQWSVDLVASWKAAGKQIQLVTLKGEEHVFEARWDEAMAAVRAFLDEHLA